jgi:ribonucleoside-diphosphate reductase alpha chain
MGKVEQLPFDLFVLGPPQEPSRQRLPSERDSYTHKFVMVGGGESIVEDGDIVQSDLDCYLTIGFYPNGKIGELFFRAGKEGEQYSVFHSLMVAISVGLQYGIPMRVFIEKMKNQQFLPNGITRSMDIPIVKSIVDYIARYLELRFGDMID